MTLRFVYQNPDTRTELSSRPERSVVEGPAVPIIQKPLSTETATFPFVIPSVPGFPTSPLSLATTDVVLPKENHMQSTEAATLYRKSGVAEGSAVRPSGFPNSGVLTHTLKPSFGMRKLRNRTSGPQMDSALAEPGY